ncbi:ABC transporter permease [Enterococcus hirae]|nr:ABC transporter permease [Enterococcus hirae]
MTRNDHHFGYLLKANLKQNLRFILIWMLVLVLMIVSGAVKFQALFESDAKGVAKMIAMLKTPGMAGVFGALPSAGTESQATVFAGVMIVFMVILGALFMIPLAISNTRGQEEDGLLEMVRARNVGRTASLTAAIVELVGLNVLLGLLYFIGLSAAHLKGADLAGNLLFCLDLAVANLMFAALALLIAQLASSTRSATMLTYAIVAVIYLVRVVTDIKDPTLTWLSPMGWAQKTDAYTTNNFWPVILMLAAASLLAGAAAVISKNRDLGAGILPERSGRARASEWLRSVPALLIRTERNAIAAWLIGSVLFGAVFGSVIGNAGDVLKENPVYRKMLSIEQLNVADRTMTLSFMNMFILIFITLAIVAGAQLIFRLRHDDDHGYLDIIHAEKASRMKIAASYFGIGLLFAIIVYVLSIFVVFFIGNATLKTPLELKYLLRMMAAGIPAVTAFLGLAILLIGAVPRVASLFWIYMGSGLIVQLFGALLSLPKHAGAFTPFGWLNDTPLHAPQTLAIWLMMIATILLVAGGMLGYKRRDLE